LNELGKKWKERSRHFLAENEENMKSLRIAGLWAKNLTRNLLKKMQGC